MKKQEKDILKYLVEKELKEMKETEEEIEFPSPDFIESRGIYEKVLAEILKSLK